ncbi:MAG: hypothetical protein ACSNEK_05125 [Parachlamydiaceae bacterium]
MTTSMNRMLINFEYEEKSRIAKIYDGILAPSVFSLFGGRKVSVLKAEELKQSKIENYPFKKTAIIAFVLALPLIGICLLVKWASREERRLTKLFANESDYADPTKENSRSKSGDEENRSAPDEKLKFSAEADSKNPYDKPLKVPTEADSKMAQDKMLGPSARKDEMRGVSLRILVNEDDLSSSNRVRQVSSDISELPSLSTTKTSDDSFSKSTPKTSDDPIGAPHDISSSELGMSFLNILPAK